MARRTHAFLREHRALPDRLAYGFYGFEVEEIAADGNLDLALNLKLAWALRNRHLFPANVQTAPRETLLRVPGFGTRTMERILRTRPHRTLRYDDLLRMGARPRAAQPSITLADRSPGLLLDSEGLRQRFASEPEQLTLL